MAESRYERTLQRACIYERSGKLAAAVTELEKAMKQTCEQEEAYYCEVWARRLRKTIESRKLAAEAAKGEGDG